MSHKMLTSRDALAGRREWFKAARFGMFIHFGLYTLHGIKENEAIVDQSYEAAIHRFNPRWFDAEAWVGLAQDNGARYLVITAKHAEGFCLWHTRQTAFSVAHTPFKRDIIRELAAACHHRKMRFGLYFNWEDRHYREPGEGAPEARTYPGLIAAQLTELLTGYGRVDLLWFDHGDARLDYRRLVALIRRLQPACLINNRLKRGYHEPPVAGDFTTPERCFPARLNRRHLFIECCDAMGLYNWGYQAGASHWSVPILLERFSRVASLGEGSNYLLNVEPRPDGRINPPCVDRMRAIGRWLRVNGEAIRDAGGCPVVPRDPTHPVDFNPSLGVSTRTERNLYLHLHQWPQGHVFFRHVTGKIARVILLGSKARLKAEYVPGVYRFKNDGAERFSYSGFVIRGFPPVPPGVGPAIVKVTFMGAWAVDQAGLAREGRKWVEAHPVLSTCLGPDSAEFITGSSGVPTHAVTRTPRGVPYCGGIWEYDMIYAWHVRVARPGRFAVYVESRSLEDAGYRIDIGPRVLTVRQPVTDRIIRPRLAGEVSLDVGRHTLTFQVTDFGQAGCQANYPGIFHVILHPVACPGV